MILCYGRVLWQPGWEGSLGSKGYMYIYGWVLHCSLKTTTTLFVISYISIQNKIYLKKKVLYTFSPHIPCTFVNEHANKTSKILVSGFIGYYCCFAVLYFRLLVYRKTLICSQPTLLAGFPAGSDGKESTCSSICGSGWSSGEVNGNPLHCSCLENSMDGRAWWAIFHWAIITQLTHLLNTFSFSFFFNRFILEGVFQIKSSMIFT